MKKIFFICCLSFVFQFLFSNDFEYRVIDDTIAFSDYLGFHKEEIKKETIINVAKSYMAIGGVIIDEEPFMFIEDEENHYKISLAYLKLKKTKQVLPEKIITYTKKGMEKKAIPTYFLDILFSEDRNTIKKYEQLKGLYSIDDIASYLSLNKFFFATITNIGIQLNNEDEFDFLNIKKISEFVYECECIISSGNPNNDNEEFRWHTVVDNTPEGKTEIISLKIDGDYLTINNKSRNVNIITLVYVNDYFIDELLSLYKTGSCDLSKVTWPRHADGSCDYDGRSKKGGKK